MAIVGAHMLIHTPEAEAARALFKDVFDWSHIDMGEGWLIFGMPPSEIGVHPSERPRHEISLMCDDLEKTIEELTERGVTFQGNARDEGWGIAITMILPGEVEMVLYEARHPTAI